MGVLMADHVAGSSGSPGESENGTMGDQRNGMNAMEKFNVEGHLPDESRIPVGVQMSPMVGPLQDS